jgi:gas vesicle structural protein
MSIVPAATTSPAGPSGGTLADTVALILDKGIVIDVFVRVSLIGIELVTIDARVVVASVDTYLRFAEKANRLNMEASRKPGLPEIIHGVAAARSKPAPPPELMAAPQAPEMPEPSRTHKPARHRKAEVS